ncbi:MAG: mechanosensitive ion channel family protein [Patescibacteria group bacterium]
MGGMATTNIRVGMEELLDLMKGWLDEHLINILVILLAAWLVRHFGTRLLSQILKRTVRSDIYPTKLDREKRIKTLKSLISAAMRVGVYLVAFVLVIGELNPSYMTALFASAGLVTVALGFGAQSLIKDFMSGVFIITENQYRVGDIIDIAGVSGTVEDITIRTTVLRDLNGYVHHVPNGIIEVTTNRTISFSQINEEFTVAKDTDLDRLEHIVNHVGEELSSLPELKDKILDKPHFDTIKGYAANGIIIKVLGRTTTSGKWRVRSELYKRLAKAFTKNKIEASGLPVSAAAHSTNKKR